MAKADPSWPTEWRAYLDARNGPHQIEAIALHSSGLIATNKTIWFTNQASDRADLSYFSEGQLTQRVNSAGTSQKLAWDGKGRLIRANERDANGNGYDWSAVYDPFGRRWKTSTFTVTNNIAVGSQPHVITSFFDPLHEFLETRVEVNGRTFYKIHGPDQNSVYGGWNGSGGLDAISDSSGVVLAYITDTTGNILGSWNSSSSQTKWNSSRPSGYGGTPGYRPPALPYDVDLAEAVSWRGKWMDITGLYWIGARYYEPVSGRFISCDPYGHDAGPSLYAFAQGDPVNYFDPDGRLMTTAGQTVARGVDAAFNYGMSTFLTPNVDNREAYSQILVEQYGSPLRRIGAYSGANPLADELAPQLGGPTQDAMMSYYVGKSIASTPRSQPSHGELQWGARLEQAATVQQTPSARPQPHPIVTVLGSSKDVAPYANQPGFNVLRIPNNIPRSQWDAYNHFWLMNAYIRGDRFWLATDPLSYSRQLGRRFGTDQGSAYFRVEMPILESLGVKENAVPAFILRDGPPLVLQGQ